MKNLVIIILSFSFHFINGFQTYSPEIYDALKVISQETPSNSTFLEKSLFLASVLHGNISMFETSKTEVDDKFLLIHLDLNKKLFIDEKMTNLSSLEKMLLAVFKNTTLNYMLLVVSPERSYQSRMAASCSRISNHHHSLIQKFNVTIEMVSASYLIRHNYTDLSFKEITEIVQVVTNQVAFTFPFCERKMNVSSEDTMKKLQNMNIFVADYLKGINEERRQKYWNSKFITHEIGKLIDGTTNDQNLADKIQNYFEYNFGKTDYVFTAFVFNNSYHPFISSDNNIQIIENEIGKYIVLTRTNERNHCAAFDRIESNVQEACVDGKGKDKVAKIKKYMIKKCPNSLFLIMDNLANFVYSTNKTKPDAKLANMSQYWRFIFDIYQQCLDQKIFIVIINY